MRIKIDIMFRYFFGDSVLFVSIGTYLMNSLFHFFRP